MSVKKLDNKNRFRDTMVSFRMSQEEQVQLQAFTKLSGQSKQEYLINRALQRDVVVQGNSRTYKAMREMLGYVLDELKRIESVNETNDELLELISQINKTMNGFKENGNKKSPYVDA